MNCLRSEYPRPDLKREKWQTLNGFWLFDFDPHNRGIREKWYKEHKYSRQIEVPFVFQSKLSGIKSEEKSDVIWYSKEFTIDSGLKKGRCLLHFGAVDYKADVWLDGYYLGSHEGGYTPFSFDITDAVSAQTESYTLTVRCEDSQDCTQPRGKQSFRSSPFECWYTPSSGIWQSVWLEGVGDYYIRSIRLTPDVDEAAIDAEICLNLPPSNCTIHLSACFDGKVHAIQSTSVFQSSVIKTRLFLPQDGQLMGVHLWQPSSPSLYDLEVKVICDGIVTDQINTYFGMRKIEICNGQILLNNQVLNQRLVLDQGYWPDGLLTAPSCESLQKDVELVLQMGFNGVRMHQKIEDPIFLYYADKCGLLVWEELPSAYYYSDLEKRNLLRDMAEVIHRDYNHPCIVVWTPLNESWGVPWIETNQNVAKFADALFALIHALDNTRLVSGNDGWEQASTDLFTVHDYSALPEELNKGYDGSYSMYFGAPGSNRLLSARSYDHRGKPIILSEYGGIAMKKDISGNNWGYNQCANTAEELLERFRSITSAAKNLPGFSGYCYTQLTDVFQEVNGLLDMHRLPKVDLQEIRRINLG